MPLNPEDVVRKTFTSVVLRRGYDEKEVDTFLEEVVAELRHLYGRVDELKAEVATLQARVSSDVASERVQREQQQVDLVRAERRELVADLAELQARYDQTSLAAQEAEQRRDEAARAVGALEQRQAELNEQVRREQQQLERIHAERDEVLAAQDRTAAELRTLRAAAEIQAEGLGPIETALSGNAQLDDLAVVTAIAHHLHTDHVEQGRAHAEELRTSAEQEATTLRETTERQCEQLRTSAEDEATTLRETTQRQCEQLLTDASRVATAEHERIVREGQETHERLVGEAEEQRAGILADLQARRELAETRIEDLNRSQRDYRDRLRHLVQDQLAALDDGAWSATAAPTEKDLAIP